MQSRKKKLFSMFGVVCEVVNKDFSKIFTQISVFHLV